MSSFLSSGTKPPPDPAAGPACREFRVSPRYADAAPGTSADPQPTPTPPLPQEPEARWRHRRRAFRLRCRRRPLPAVEPRARGGDVEHHRRRDPVSLLPVLARVQQDVRERVTDFAGVRARAGCARTARPGSPEYAVHGPREPIPTDFIPRPSASCPPSPRPDAHDRAGSSSGRRELPALAAPAQPASTPAGSAGLATMEDRAARAASRGPRCRAAPSVVGRGARAAASTPACVPPQRACRHAPGTPAGAVSLALPSILNIAVFDDYVNCVADCKPNRSRDGRIPRAPTETRTTLPSRAKQRSTRLRERIHLRHQSPRTHRGVRRILSRFCSLAPPSLPPAHCASASADPLCSAY